MIKTAFLALLALAFAAVAVVLTPALVSPYLPPQASRLNELLIEGIQLMRVLFAGGAVLALATEICRRLWPPLDESQTGSGFTARDLATAGLLVAVALCLRVPNIGESLWWDELGTLMRVVERGLPVIIGFSADGNNHIGNSLLMWVASKFGRQDWVLRLPSFIIGCLLPAAVFLALQRVASRRVALIAATLLVIQFRMVDFSAEARGYIGHMAFAALSSVAFASLCVAWSWRRALLYATTATWAIWFVITGVYLVAGHVVIASGLLLYQWVQSGRGVAGSSAPAIWRRYFWSAAAGCWALFAGLLVHVLTLPQVIDYSRNWAPSYHSQLDLAFYKNALPYLVGVEHHIASGLLALVAVAGYWVARRDWRAWLPIVGGPLFLIVCFQLSRNVASPRLFVSTIFPLLVGISFFVDSQWRRGLVSRAVAVVTIALLAGDSVPVFARYYTVGNPELRELATRIPAKDVFLANMQAGSNVHYFPESSWELDGAKVGSRLEAIDPAPKFVLWGDDCRRRETPEVLEHEYRRIETFDDWTLAEYAPNQRRPCFYLYEHTDDSRLLSVGTVPTPSR